MEYPKKSRIEVLEIWLRFFAILIGGIWIFSTYIYEKYYLPNNEYSFLHINPLVKKIGNYKKYDTFEITIRYTNTSKAREKLIASWYHMIGNRYEFKSDLADNIFIKENNFFLDSASSFSRYITTNTEKSKTIETGYLFDAIWLNPGQEVAKTFISFVPKKRFNTIKCIFYGTTIKEDSKVDTRWSVTTDKGEVIPEFALNLSNGEGPRWESLDDNKHSDYIKKYDMIFTRQELEIFLK